MHKIIIYARKQPIVNKTAFALTRKLQLACVPSNVDEAKNCFMATVDLRQWNRQNWTAIQGVRIIRAVFDGKSLERRIHVCKKRNQIKIVYKNKNSSRGFFVLKGEYKSL